MLKIKDQKGKVVGILKDSDTEPLMVVKSKCICPEGCDDECQCEEEEGEEENADVD